MEMRSTHVISASDIPVIVNSNQMALYLCETKSLMTPSDLTRLKKTVEITQNIGHSSKPLAMIMDLNQQLQEMSIATISHLSPPPSVSRDKASTLVGRYPHISITKAVAVSKACLL